MSRGQTTSLSELVYEAAIDAAKLAYLDAFEQTPHIDHYQLEKSRQLMFLARYFSVPFAEKTPMHTELEHHLHLPTQYEHTSSAYIIDQALALYSIVQDERDRIGVDELAIRAGIHYLLGMDDTSINKHK